MPSYIKPLTAAVFLFGSLIAPARAGSISAIYSFGDSLSDAGNDFVLTSGAIPAAPYVNGHFTNGQVWVQDLSASLGLGAVTNSLSGGNDYAYGGAETGITPFNLSNPTPNIDLTGAGGQISQFLTTHPAADPNGLYTIWIGADDLRAIPANATPAAAAADIAAAVANIDSAINTLAAAGAKNFLVATVPDLGKAPAEAGNPALATQLSAAFDSTLVNGFTPAGVPSLTSLAAAEGLHLSILDTFSLLDAIVADPSAYGFTNVTTPCDATAVDFSGGTACSPNVSVQNQYLFWDTLHPTAGGHQILADEALLAIPEPASYALIGAGLLGLFLQRRKRTS